MSPALPLTVIATVTWHDMEAMAERLVELATGGPGAASLLAARPWAAVSPFRSQSATAKQNEPFPHNRNRMNHSHTIEIRLQPGLLENRQLRSVHLGRCLAEPLDRRHPREELPALEMLVHTGIHIQPKTGWCTAPCSRNRSVRYRGQRESIPERRRARLQVPTDCELTVPRKRA